MIKTAPRISKTTAEFIPGQFRTLNAGCEHILNSWPGLFRLTLNELKERFSQGELGIMLDVMNGSMIGSDNYGRHLTMNCTDGVALYRLDKKWNIEKDPFFEKLGNLTTFQAACLEIWANAFWYSQTAKNSEGTIEDYIKSLL